LQNASRSFHLASSFISQSAETKLLNASAKLQNSKLLQ